MVVSNNLENILNIDLVTRSLTVQTNSKTDDWW